MGTKAMDGGKGLVFSSRYMKRGLAAARPVTGIAPDGMFIQYYSTDTEVLNIWDGSAWVQFSAGGSSELPAGSLRSVDNSNIPSGYILLNGTEVDPDALPNIEDLLPTVTNKRYDSFSFNVLASGALVGAGNLTSDSPPLCVRYIRSTDNGASWTPSNAFYTPNSATTPVSSTSYPLAVASNGTNVVACGIADDFTYSEGTIWYSTDSGVTWTIINQNYLARMIERESTICYDVIFGNGFWVIPTYEGVYFSTNMTSWSFKKIIEGVTFTSVAYDSTFNKFVISGQDEGSSPFLYTISDTDPGGDWASKDVGSSRFLFGLIADSGTITGYDSSEQKFYQSYDGGDIWNAMDSDFAVSSFTLDTATGLFIATDSTVVKTSDSLSTWTTRYTATGGDSLNQIHSRSGETYCLVTGTTEHKMLHSSNGTTYAITGNLPRVTASFCRIVREGSLDIFTAMKT